LCAWTSLNKQILCYLLLRYLGFKKVSSDQQKHILALPKDCSKKRQVIPQKEKSGKKFEGVLRVILKSWLSFFLKRKNIISSLSFLMV
jgi:hypothetical protein